MLCHLQTPHSLHATTRCQRARMRLQRGCRAPSACSNAVVSRPPAARCRRPHLVCHASADEQQASSTSTSTSTAAQDAAAPAAAPKQQLLLQRAFTALSATSLALGTSALAAPQLLLTAAGLGEGSALTLAFLRIAGATMAISASVEYSLQDAIAAGHLKSATYQRLLAGVICKSVLYLVAFALSPELLNPLLLVTYPTAALASIGVSAATLIIGFQQAGISSPASAWSALVGSGLSPPKSAAGWAYSVFLLLYAATVAACYAPEVIFTEPLAPEALLLKHIWGPGFVLCGAACWVLGDAADRGRLGASTFRRLNLGLAGVELGYAATFAWCIAHGFATADGSSLSNLAGSIGISAYALVQFAATAKK